jgi:RNA polymerase sigma-70 factor (ECF subfamily)
MRLPVRQRQVVALRLLLDLDTRQTAQVLDISPNTVMAHRGQALTALRHDLVPEPQQEGPS